MAKRESKESLEKRLAKAEERLGELSKVNGVQLGRLVDTELLKMRIVELERMLDDAIDERDRARASESLARKELERVAMGRGMVAR